MFMKSCRLKLYKEHPYTLDQDLPFVNVLLFAFSVVLLLVCTHTCAHILMCIYYMHRFFQNIWR